MTEKIGRLAYKTGAISYFLWGALHVYAAYLSFELASEQEFGTLQSKVYQNGWNLAYLSIFCATVAVLYNWRNSVTGYWLNLITISAVDIGFIALIYLPGHSSDLLGPALWITGAVLTTIGILFSPKTG